MNKNITALTSAFSRAYHYKNSDAPIFNDTIADKILTEIEYENISMNMTKGIKFFNPDFKGNNMQAIRWIVDNYLSPSPIGRSAFTEERLELGISLGTSQYLIFASGYDTFAYRQKKNSKQINIFEIDRSEMIEDKINRVKPYLDEIDNLDFIKIDFNTEISKRLLNSKYFDESKKSFCSLLGISYYLKKEHFKNLLEQISLIVPNGSSIVFDYPDENYYTEFAEPRAKNKS